MLDGAIDKEILNVSLLDVALPSRIETIEETGWCKLRLLGKHLLDCLQFPLQLGSIDQHLDKLPFRKLTFP